MNSAAPQAAADNPRCAYSQTRADTRGLLRLDRYFEIYQSHFTRFIRQPMVIMEIGVYRSGSLGLWRHVLGDQCQIIGVDIDKKCLSYANDHTQVLIGDQADRAF